MSVHHGQLLVEEVAGGVSVMNQNIFNGVAVFAQFHCFEKESVAYQTFVFIFAEEHLFAVNQVDGAFSAGLAVGDEVE